MFTGIVQAMGKIEALEPRGGDLRLVIDVGDLPLDAVRPGDSIAVNGCCLTAVEIGKRGFTADVSRETLASTTLGELRAGSRVNLEPALTPATPLGGHLVSGHVDGVGEVLERRSDARSERIRFRLPRGLARYVARKGSICVDGVSLTVNEVEEDIFGVNVVPRTLDATIIGDYRGGTRVNIEVDLIARYLERLLQSGGMHEGVDHEQLRRHGFIGE